MSVDISTIFERSMIKNTINLFNTSNNSTFFKDYFGKDVKKFVISSDKTLAVALSYSDSTITIIDLMNLTKFEPTTNLIKPLDVLISNDNNYLYIICRNSNLLYKVSTSTSSTTVTSIQLSLYPKKLVANSDFSKIYCAGYTNKIDVVNTSTFLISNTIKLSLDYFYYRILDFKISNDNTKLIYSSKYNGLIELIDLATNTSSNIQLITLNPRINMKNFVFSSDSSTIYVIALNLKNTVLYKLSTTGNVLSIVSAITFSSSRITDLLLSADGNSLYLLDKIN